ncbi:MAG: VanZ family protein [Lachnospiraceae bacterium]|jgi:glycopeptide antibiotics resistance protein|nr:VanZ family protein [Lachnospiraceae bacterium]
METVVKGNIVQKNFMIESISYLEPSLRMVTPGMVLVAVILAAVAGILYSCFTEKKGTTARCFAAGCLVFYLSLVYASTVFGRKVRATYTYELMPFWSYQEIAAGNTKLLIENFWNVMLLLPVGILLPVCTERTRLRSVAFTGFILSGTIEVAQLVMKRGLFEFDDIFHNVAGTAIGYGIYTASRYYCKCRKKSLQTQKKYV